MIHAVASEHAGAPAERVFALYEAPGNWPRIFPATIRGVRIVRTEGDEKVVEVDYVEGKVMNVMRTVSLTRIDLRESKRRYDATFTSEFIRGGEVRSVLGRVAGSARRLHFDERHELASRLPRPDPVRQDGTGVGQLPRLLLARSVTASIRSCDRPVTIGDWSRVPRRLLTRGGGRDRRSAHPVRSVEECRTRSATLACTWANLRAWRVGTSSRRRIPGLSCLAALPPEPVQRRPSRTELSVQEVEEARGPNSSHSLR
jgi:hypothetical protein